MGQLKDNISIGKQKSGSTKNERSTGLKPSSKVTHISSI